MRQVKPHRPRHADASAELRRRAEYVLHESTTSAGSPPAAGDELRLLHELRVHQIELELQNEELRRSKAEVEAGLERFADFYDFSPVGFFTLERDGTIARLNLTGARLLRTERSRLVGKRFAEFTDPAGRLAFNAFLQDVFAGESGRRCELMLAADDQSMRMVQIDATLAPDRLECRAVVVDITEGKHMADLLRDSSQFNAEVIDNAQEGIVVYGPGLRYQVWNAYMEELTGVRACDVLGRHPLEVFPFLLERGVMANLEGALAGGTTKSVEFPFRITQTGRAGWVVDRTAPLRNARGEIVGVIGTVTDITDRREAAEKLREMAENMEAKVVERTAQLRRLSAQLTMAEERERRKLAQDLHDNLGQLLAVIKIKLTSVSAGALQPLVDQIVALLAQADQAARTITQELSPPVLHRLGLVPALQWLAEDIERTYGVMVHVDHHDNCPIFLSDDIQAVLYRAARELLINVAKHAGVQDASLSCLCDGNRLLLVVSDAGCGFEAARHLGFRPGHHSFGLRSIFERITNLGGEMEIDSSPGNGATVTLNMSRSIGQKEIRDDPHNACR